VLTLGAKQGEAAHIREIVEVFLTSECTEERHQRRVKKIVAIEDGGGK
jgi:ribose 5-phosphate isomerase RpiB